MSSESKSQESQADESVLPFIQTKEYRRFAEFCDDCRKYRYIGLCHGPPGVGKSFSARHYTSWDHVEAQFHEQFYTFGKLPNAEVVIANSFRMDIATRPQELLSCRSVLFTPAVANTPRQIENEVRALRMALSYLVEDAERFQIEERGRRGTVPDRTQLMIVDEADRLKAPGLETIRDIYDRSRIGVVLVGMPGLEKRLSRYQQLSSRVGFVHQFRQLNEEETQRVLEEQWQHWGVILQPDGWKDAEAVSAIMRITGGNFRLIQRLLTQIERIVQINSLRAVTKEVVEVAREQLVIGLT